MSKLKFVLFFIILVGSLSLSAQTFQATDIVFANNISDSEKQSMRRKTLGKEVKLTTFDNDIKFETISKGWESEYEPLIFHYVSKDKYKYTDRYDTFILTIDKIMGYYKSIKLEVWRDDEYQWTVIMKRK